MKLLSRKLGLIMLPIGGFILITMYLFSSSKNSECHQILNIVSQSNSLINANKDKNDAITTNKLAKDLKDIANTMENREIKDATLKQLNSRQAQTLKELSQALGQMGTILITIKDIKPSFAARQQLNRAKVQIVEAGQAAEKMAEQQDLIHKEILSYCQVKN
jgi:hypothetical protein